MNKNKNILIAVTLIVFALVAGSLLSPYFIEYYFNKQSIYSISESKERLYINTFYKPKNDSISLGQSIVLRGYINENDKFTLIDSDKQKNTTTSYVRLEPVTDKINCFPYKSGNYKIVGAYNFNQIPISDQYDNPIYLSSSELKFYVLWTLGGCE